jgi:hypothetical protein
LNSFYLFFGLAVFGFEGVNLAIPIESAMAHRKSYPKGIPVIVATLTCATSSRYVHCVCGCDVHLVCSHRCVLTS